MHLQQTVVELEVLLARIDRGELDVPWQSGPGWDLRRRQRLIDTVVRGWPVPAIVIGSTDEREVVLDGRERLRALRQFSRDDFPFADGMPGIQENLEDLEQLDGLRWGQWPEPFRRRVQRYGVHVVRLSAYGESEARELISRWAPPGDTGAAAVVSAEALENSGTLQSPATPGLTLPDPLDAPTAPMSRPALTPADPVPPPPVPTTPAPSPPVPRRPEVSQQATPGTVAPPPAPLEPTRAGGAQHRATVSEPIFDELSAWFLDDPDLLERGSSAPSWSSPADPGYEAARTALRTPATDVTGAGLPLREPAARLAPGAVERPPRSAPPRAADPRAIGDHLTRLRAGKAAARDDRPPPS
jgi:hypothetical protein